MSRRTALLIAMLAGCASAQQPLAVGSKPPALRKLVVVGVNDTHGALLSAPAPKWLQRHTDAPVGGADWFAGWLEAIRAEARDTGGAVVLLDGGDMFQGTLISNQFKGRSVVEVYEAVGLAAAAIGNHEFDFGQAALIERIKEARFPILGANVFYKGTRQRPEWARPTVMIEAGGVKVGIIGLLTAETATVTNPAFVTDLEFVDGGPIAAPLADELRAAGATVVLITAHAGPLPGGAADREVQRIAQACAGKVDAIVSGHTHISVGCCRDGEERCRCGTGPITVAGIPVVQSGAKLTQISLIEIDLDDAGRARGFRVNDGTFPHPGGPQPLFQRFRGKAPRWRGHEVRPVERVAAIVAKYDAGVKSLRDTRIGATKVPLIKGGDDALLANLAVDALRSGAGGGLKASFAFQNQGGLRISEIPAGPITYGQIFDLSPFDNQQVVVTLKAHEVRNALEAVIKAGKGALRVSGLNYTVDWSRHRPERKLSSEPPGSLVTLMTDEAGAPLCRTESCTETACTASCAQGDFTVALTDFLANGGDGLAMLKEARRQVGPVLARDILVEFVKANNPLTPDLLGAGRRRVVQTGREERESRAE